jgi:hypothetical protein
MGTGTAAAALATIFATGLALATAPPDQARERLSDTGLFAPGSIDAAGAGVRSFTPQYPLWSDGATKRRWMRLPSGGVIDATQPAAWVFPAGTRFWKEFSVGGRRIETRMIERLPDDGEWRFVAYVWNDAQTEATLVPAEGMRLPLPDGARYTIPSEADCRACHAGAASPILGFTALQLSADRDPLAPHAEPWRPDDLELRALAQSGGLVNLPQALLETPPRISAPAPAGRAVLGYLNANCGHCHADPNLAGAAVPVELQLAIDPTDPLAGERVVRTLVESVSRYRPAGTTDARLIVPGDAKSGTLLTRIRSRDPRVQMPPLGTAKPDLEAIALIERWIQHDLSAPANPPPNTLASATNTPANTSTNIPRENTP